MPNPVQSEVKVIVAKRRVNKKERKRKRGREIVRKRKKGRTRAKKRECVRKSKNDRINAVRE